MKTETKRLYNVLERLYARYNRRRCIGLDPLAFLYRYSRPRDIEIVAFLSAALAYGRVRQITASLTDLLGRMCPNPYDFTVGFELRRREELASFKHRFTSGHDVADLLAVFREMLEKSGSIEKFFLAGYSPRDESVIPAIESFCSRALSIHNRLAGRPAGRGLRYLLARPGDGSACKRINLFLRWMARKDEVDPGIWKGLDKARLIVPLDVHMARLTAILGLHRARSVSLRTAVTVTRAFAEIAPADPVKYDFALSRVGIMEGCTGSLRASCRDCELLVFCRPETGRIQADPETAPAERKTPGDMRK